MKGFAGGLVGAVGLSAMLSANREEAEKATKALEDFVNAMTFTLAMTKDPRFLEIGGRAAIESGRPIGEVGNALGIITTMMGGAPVEERAEMLKQVIETAEAYGTENLGPLAGLFTQFRKLSKGALAPQQLQNLIITMMESAHLNLEELGGLFPRTEKGQLAGANLEDMAAIFATLSASMDPSQAKRATQDLLLRLVTPSPEGVKVLRGLGIDTRGGSMAILGQLAERQAVSPIGAQAIVDLMSGVGGTGGTGAAALPTLLDQYPTLEANRAAIAASMAAGAGDIGAETMQFLRKEMPGFALTERKRQAEQEAEVARARDVIGTSYDLRTAMAEAEFAKQGTPGMVSWLMRNGRRATEGLSEVIDAIIGPSAYDLARRERGRAALVVGHLHQTNINTNYQGPEPGRQSPPELPLNR